MKIVFYNTIREVWGQPFDIRDDFLEYFRDYAPDFLALYELRYIKRKNSPQQATQADRAKRPAP